VTLEVLFATLVFALAISAYDNWAALLYGVVVLNAGSLENWLILTLAFLTWYLVRGLARSVRG
jgi:hypothetical protein